MIEQEIPVCASPADLRGIERRSPAERDRAIARRRCVARLNPLDRGAAWALVGDGDRVWKTAPIGVAAEREPHVIGPGVLRRRSSWSVGSLPQRSCRWRSCWRRRELACPCPSWQVRRPWWSSPRNCPRRLPCRLKSSRCRPVTGRHCLRRWARRLWPCQGSRLPRRCRSSDCCRWLRRAWCGARRCRRSEPCRNRVFVLSVRVMSPAPLRAWLIKK